MRLLLREIRWLVIINKINNMRILLTTLLFISMANLGFADGAIGVYYIRGTAFGAGKSDTLKNVELAVKIKNETRNIKTDDKGEFVIEIPWSGACPTGSTPEDMARQERMYNPRYIYVKYSGKEVKIINEWKKYARESFKTKEEVTKNQNIFFK